MTFPVPAPEIPDAVLEQHGWEETSGDTETMTKDVFGAVEVEALAHTKKYKVADAPDDDARLLFVNRTRTKPGFEDLPFGVGEERVKDIIKSFARDRFKDEFRERGVSGIEEGEEEETTTETGETAELQRFDATRTVGGVDVDVSGWIGVWYRDGDVFTAGGVYPEGDEEDGEEILNLIKSVR
ncbi:MAG: DUF6517 family protein [Halobacteriales archaeon]|nr:DUF6517 family protein [Halobacteriales archaeon]